MELPLNYQKQMEILLGDDYPSYRDSFSTLPGKGLRVNEWKITIPDFLSLWKDMGLPDPEPIPWIHNGFFIPEGVDAGKLSLYQAGLYYIQEPAAMTPAEFLPVHPGERVLDLCAAPGGKSTELLSKLRGEGILISNDISASRAKALKKNLEMAGAVNACVTAETPERLLGFFPRFFDKILLDVPCSGEGMFRTQPKMMQHWEEEGPEFYAKIQKEILESAYQMLAPGGMLMYSTCTFSPIEDEEQLLSFLRDHPDMHPVDLPHYDGFSYPVDEKGEKLPFVKLYPHKIRGEGQFAGLLLKDGVLPERKYSEGVIRARQNEFDRIPSDLPVFPSLHYLMTGLHLATKKGKRIALSQAYAMSLKEREWPVTLRLLASDERVIRYLKGESIALSQEEQDDLSAGRSASSPIRLPGQTNTEEVKDVLVMLESYPLGFGRMNRSMLKNGRPGGWRLQ